MKWAITMIMTMSTGLVAAKGMDDRLLAQYVYNFANFVEWPESAYDDKEAPLRICLFGDVPFAKYVDVYDGAFIKGRELSVVITKNHKLIKSGCHVLYVGNDQKSRLQEFFDNLNHKFVLSVSSIEKDFIEKGGILYVHQNSNKELFSINLEKAKQEGLFISSDLLAISQVINAQVKAIDKKHNKK